MAKKLKNIKHSYKKNNPTMLKIKHYYQNSRMSYQEIADKVGLKTKQAVAWYITYYKIEKKPVKEYVGR